MITFGYNFVKNILGWNKIFLFAIYIMYNPLQILLIAELSI